MQRSAHDFKVGFLRKIAQMGLLPSDFEAAMQKNASFVNWMKGLGGVAALGGRGMQYGLGIPLLAGTLTGAAARAASRADDEDLDEVKDQEMTSVYRQLAKEVRERTQREQQRRGLSTG